MRIKFTNISGMDFFDLPEPASHFIPQWYKDSESFINKKKVPNVEISNSGNTSTIKKCMPVFDAITAGYIITTPVDIYVEIKNEEPYFQWPLGNPIAFHPVEQAPLHPERKKDFSYPKFINPWAIKTPKGYSCYFIQPVHRESPFKILEGFVDTDTYTAAVNFPFVMKDPSFEGLIPKGTPIAQVIPIKRDKWKMEIGSKEDVIQANKVSSLLHTLFFDGYKIQFWNHKEFK